MTTNASVGRVAPAAPGRTRVALLAVLVCAWGLLAACRPSVAEASGSPPPPSPTGPAAGSPTEAAPAAGSATTPAAGSAITPPCRGSIVRVAVGRRDAGSGHRGVALVFTNTGVQPCRLSGYPGVAGLDAAGSQVAQARRTLHGYMGGLSAGSPPALTLAPRESASALVEALAFNASDGSACTAFAGLLVTVPDDTVSTRVPWNNDGCGGLQVHPVVPGTSGRTS